MCVWKLQPLPNNYYKHKSTASYFFTTSFWSTFNDLWHFLCERIPEKCAGKMYVNMSLSVLLSVSYAKNINSIFNYKINYKNFNCNQDCRLLNIVISDRKWWNYPNYLFISHFALIFFIYLSNKLIDYELKLVTRIQ